MQGNSSIVTNMSRPLLSLSFKNPNIQVKKPLVQVQCHTVFDPDMEKTEFAFPHGDLQTPPLDSFVNETWRLPNDFVLNMVDDATDLFKNYGTRLLFSWFDTANHFTKAGAPSLGAVVLFAATNGSTTVGTCTIDGRWAPVKLFFDPKTDTIVRQDSPDPRDALNLKKQGSTTKHDADEIEP